MQYDEEIKSAYRAARRLFLGIALGAVLLSAQDYVQVTPPPIRPERVGRKPGLRYVWVHGNQQWNGRAYVWTPGYWALKPSMKAVWIDGRWVHKPKGWLWIPGKWRS